MQKSRSRTRAGATLPLLALAGALTVPYPASAAPQSATPVPSNSSAINPHPAKARSLAVTYLFPEQVTIPANQATSVDLHFKIADGLHINSHHPRTEDLIPTTLSLPPEDQTAQTAQNSHAVRLVNVTFPPGSDFHFTNETASQEKLSVYTGEFTIRAELLSSPGDHLVEATLRYQACDTQSCMPPHTIPVTLDVIAK